MNLFWSILLGFYACTESEKKMDPSIEEPSNEPENSDPSTEEPESQPTSEPETSNPAEPDSQPSSEPVEDCPDGVICVNTFPFEHSGDTSLSSLREWDSYDCASATDESGAEILYRVDIEEEGFLALELMDMESGADIDIHLLASRDNGDCLDRGHWRAGAFVQPGSYWVVADTWVNSSGMQPV